LGAVAFECGEVVPLHRLLGIPMAIEMPLDNITSVELFRHQFSMITRARVVVAGGVAEETYVFSTWVGEELIAAGAPRRGRDDEESSS
jgi:hypothetical protein